MSLPNESDLVLVLWANRSSSSGRVFETITKHGSHNPVAWRLSYLQSKYSGVLPEAVLVNSEDELRSWMCEPLLSSSSRDKPLLVPVRFVRIVLGWSDFDVWDGEHA